MELNLQEGTKGLMEMTVGEKDSAQKMGSGTINVYATPAMVALMENAAQSSVQESLPEGFSTVGIEINVKHIKATPIGMKVKCETVLKKVDRKKLFFEIEAFDEVGKIGEATHWRYIVNEHDFLQRIQKVD